MSQAEHLIHAELSGARSEIPQASNPVIETLCADDATLARYLEYADIPTLLMTTAHLTGDLSILKQQWRPVIDMAGVAISGMSADGEAEVREFCLHRLCAFRNSGAAVPQRPTDEQLQHIADWVMGPVIKPYLPMLAEELVANGEDPRQPSWSKATVAPIRDFHVAIIGAGESGLCLAFRLKQAGVPFTIYEKNADVGGTWLENHYPGCRVDVNSFLYSYAFARRTWKDYFTAAPDVLTYLQDVATGAGLYQHIRFNSRITAASWDADAGVWELDVETDGRSERVRNNMAVFAVGQLNRPMIPEIAGRDDFQGPSFHSARWDHDVELTGKRVGVIGTGASAVQFIKEIAKQNADVCIFSRTTNWLLPTDNLLEPVSAEKAWLLDNLPNYALWFRASMAMPQMIGFLDGITVDPDYPPTETAVSAVNDEIRAAITAWIEPQFAERPDLRDAIIPNSPLGAKRILRDNGSWLATLQRDNVRVVKQRIEAITAQGIRCADGGEHEFDVIIYGTGFHASEFLVPVDVTGRNGEKLHDKWQDDARAYAGSTVPGFPNMFMMYGPNTNLVVHGGSIIMFSELTTTYIVDAARLLLEGEHRSMEVRGQVYDDYNARVDERNRQLAFGFSKVNSWYKNSKGRVSQNFPFYADEFWRLTHKVELADYIIS